MPSDVTRILSAIEQGDPSAADQLLPLVYDALQFPDVTAPHSLVVRIQRSSVIISVRGLAWRE